MKPKPKYGFLVISMECDEILSVQHIGGDVFEMVVVAVNRASRNDLPIDLITEQLMTLAPIVNFAQYSSTTTSISVIKLDKEPF